jgi:hypothetical protein
MGLKRTSTTYVPQNALVHSNMMTMRTNEDTSRTSATKILFNLKAYTRVPTWYLVDLATCIHDEFS